MQTTSKTSLVLNIIYEKIIPCFKFHQPMIVKNKKMESLKR